MIEVATKHTNHLTGGKRPSLSGPGGGMLGKMFGGPNNGKEASPDRAAAGKDSPAPDAQDSPKLINPFNGNGVEDTKDGSPTRAAPNTTSSPSQSGEIKPTSRTNSEDSTMSQPKRRSSGVGRIFSSAKQSLSNLGSGGDKSGEPQTPMQKLGKKDPALNVPQGSLNNSAGESVPTPRSTFRVGVTEDKNKKCRRTMEDTHAYLYNFLNTPAPAVVPEKESKSSLSLSLTRTRTKDSIGPSNASGVSVSSRGSGSLPEREVIETDNGYFAIFDGHAGTFAADWCGKKVHILLEEIIRKNPNSPIPELLDQTFTTVDQQLEKLPLKNSGCTAVIAVLRWEDRIPNAQSATGSTAIAPAVANAATSGSESAPAYADASKDAPTTSVENKLRETASRQRVLYTANVGDARIVLCRNGKALRLSYDHKGSDENEGKRIAGAGGLILNNRVNGVLAVTRALGDAYMKDLVTGHPYTTETVIQPEIDEFLILACDGLWDVCSDQEAVDLVRSTADPQLASKMLVDHALARFSTDNLSCMIVRFDNKALLHSNHSDELIGVEGDSHSTGGLSEAQKILQDAERMTSKRQGSPLAIARVHTEEVIREVEENQEPGPELELNPHAPEAAKRV